SASPPRRSSQRSPPAWPRSAKPVSAATALAVAPCGIARRRQRSETGCFAPGWRARCEESRMKLPIYQVDAFTQERFKGNSAAVVPLEHWLSDAQMQSIAMENNLSETAFLVREADGAFHIRWFSPLTEIDFCGHATLASAFVLLEQQIASAPLTFRAGAVGDISVARLDDGRLEMNFPNRAPEPVDNPPV